MDAERFKQVFLPFHKKLYRMAYRFLENQPDAEDMVQETYIKLWRKCHEPESLINPESFAVTLLKNTCLDFLRKVKPDVLPMYEIHVPASESVEEQIEKQEQLKYIQVIMSQLSEQQRQVVELKIWDNLSDEEIARQTGLKKGNIKVIISRARKIIKERYLKLEKDENK